MFKINFFMRKRMGTSLDQFSNYWRERHGPYAMSGRTSTLGMNRYVQNHLTLTPQSASVSAKTGPGEAPFEGICQIWFDSEEAVLKTRASADGARATEDLVSDERSFIDLHDSAIRFYREEVLIDRLPGSGAHKLVIGAYLRDADGAARVRSRIAAILDRIDRQSTGPVRAVYNIGLDSPANAQLRKPRGNDRDAFDCALELWFADYASIACAIEEDGGLLSSVMAALDPDLGEGGVSAWIAQERIMVGGDIEVSVAA